MWNTIYTIAWWAFIILVLAVGAYILLLVTLTLLDRRKFPLTRKYDDGGYYVGQVNNASEDQAAAHIGLYFKWCLFRGLVDEEELASLEGDEGNTLEAVRNGQLTATDYLWDTITCKFADDDLTDEGNAFTRWYYPRRYLKDLHSVTGKPECSYTESEVDFGALSTLLDQRFAQWKASSNE